MTDTPEPLEALGLGFVLRVRNLRACAEFYNQVLELPIRFREDRKICLSLGQGYLLLIADDAATVASGNMTLRLSARDVAVTAGRLSMRNVPVEISRDETGTIAIFRDPDGNPCEVRLAEAGFFNGT